MLYVTSRDHRDAYTSHRALTQDRGPDGGLFLPFRLPRYTLDEISSFEKMSFSQRVAEILNRFFGTKLSGYDVEFCVGRAPVRLKNLSHRIIMAELWYNPGWEYGWMVRKISEHILSKYQITHCSEWTFVAVRIAILFGIYGQLLGNGVIGCGETVDVSLVSGDFSAPMAVWYARAMGLPIGNIVCCCNENNSLWELMHQGSLRTNSVAVSTNISEADIVVPASLERLIHACGGYGEVTRYLDICRRGAIYAPNEVMINRMCTGLNVRVVSESRIFDAIKSVYSTYSYLMGPYTALGYTGLLDYRSRTGESRYALVLSDKSPAIHDSLVADAMGISIYQVKAIIDQM